MIEKKSFNVERILALVKKDKKRQEELSLALHSIKHHMDHCWYHYQEFKAAIKFHDYAMHNELPAGTEIQNPQYYRCAFEANCFAFFSGLHALIDNLPFVLYVLDGDLNFKDKAFWGKAKLSLKGIGSETLSERLDTFTNQETFLELKELVNTIKHRRLPRIDSANDSADRDASFVNSDLDFKLSETSILKLMEKFHVEIVEKLLIEFIYDLGEYLTSSQIQKAQIK